MSCKNNVLLNKIKVSVIIPCYNSERFLHECIDSVLNQTLNDIEIICVDDGSVDNTLSILNEYSKIDDRVKVLTQKNQYAGVARNNGMSVATGKYLSFLDSDDFFDPMMLEKMYLKSEEDCADICFTGSGTYDLRTRSVSYSGVRYRLLPAKIPFSKNNTLRILQTSKISLGCKLYKKSFIDDLDLKFQALERGNDIYFNQCAIAMAERITMIDAWLRTYRVGSSTSLVETMDKRPFCFYEANKAVKEFLIEKQLYRKIIKSFREATLDSGLHALNVAKTKDAWLKCALFLKKKYIPEFELLKCLDFLPPESQKYKDLKFLAESSNEDLREHRPLLRTDESVAKVIPEWSFELNKNSVKISIIIPCYNSEKFIEECLRSVLDQTLTNIEIICVNDGSSDNSLEILNYHAEKDDRIKVISQENKGVAIARNVGLDFANGEYVMFMDSDDLILKMSLEHLYRKAKYNDLDQLFYEGAVIYESRILYKHKSEMLNYYKYRGEYPSVYRGIEILRSLVEDRNLRSHPCMQLFKLDFLRDNNIFFKDGMKHEDNIFTLTALVNANRVMIYKEQLYIKRIRRYSFTSEKICFQNIYGYFECLLYLEDLNEVIDVDTNKSLYSLYSNSLFNNWDRIEKEHSIITNEMLKNVDKLLNNGKLRIDLQNKYFSYILKSFSLLKGTDLSKNEKNFKYWLSLVRLTLQHINTKTINDVLQKEIFSTDNQSDVLIVKDVL